MMIKLCLSERPDTMSRYRIYCSFLTVIDVHESVDLMNNLEQELKSKRMLYSKHHLKLGKVIGEG